MSAGTFLLLFATLAISTAPVFINLCDMPAFFMVAGRMLLSSLILFPFAFPYLKSLRTLKRMDWLLLVLAGVLFCFHFFFFISAFEYTSYESAVILLSVQPVMAALLARIILHEKTTLSMWIASLIAGLGLVFFVASDLKEHQDLLEAGPLFGDFLVLCACLTIVLALICARKLRQKLPYTLFSTALFGFGGGTALLIFLIFYFPFYSLLQDHKALPAWTLDGSSWLWLGALAFVPTILGHSVFQYLVKQVKVFYINFMVLASPLLSVVMKLLLDNPERFGHFELGAQKVLGALLLFFGVALGLIGRERGIQGLKPKK